MKAEEFDGDDFAMMKAMIRRRFARMLIEREEDTPDEPFSLAEKGLGDEGQRRTRAA